MYRSGRDPQHAGLFGEFAITGFADKNSNIRAIRVIRGKVKKDPCASLPATGFESRPCLVYACREMAAGKRRRRLLRGIAGILIAIVALVALFPVWFPWLLRPVAKSFGIRFGAYERISYAHFVARNVTFTNDNIRLSAERVDARIQSILFRRVDDVAITGWSLVITPSEGSSEPRTNKSVYDVYQQVRRITSKVQQWIPKGTATAGSIRVKDEIIAIPRLEISVPHISVKASSPARKQDLEIVAVVAPKGVDHFSLTNSSLQIGLNLSAMANSQGLAIQSTNSWTTNLFTLDAYFATKDRLPRAADLIAHAFVIPPELLPTNALQAFSGSLEAHWRTNMFDLRMDGLATTVTSNQTGPLVINLHATGDPKSLTLRQANVSGSGIQIEVKEGTRLVYAPPFLSETGALTAFIDLGKQTNFPVSGKIKADVLAYSGPNRIPEISFTAAGPNLLFPKIEARDFKVVGSLEWPFLRIREAKAEFDAATATTSGEFNLTNRAIAARAHLAAGESGSAELQLSTAGDWRGSPARGEFSAAIKGLDSSVFTNLLSPQSGNWQVDHANIQGDWTNGPVMFHLSGQGQWRGSNQPIFSLAADLTGNEDGVSISRLDASANGELVAQAKGTVPVTFLPQTTNQFHIEWGKPVQIQTTVLPHGFFWNELTNRFPLVLKNPDLHAELSGTLRQPLGHLSLRLDELRYRDAAPEVPPLAQIALDADISPTNAEMSKLFFFIAKQRVNFSSQLPFKNQY